MKDGSPGISSSYGNIECTGLVKDTKLANIVCQPAKKPPKYSKNGEVVNTSSLTTTTMRNI
jgi:hypothetical protein